MGDLLIWPTALERPNDPAVEGEESLLHQSFRAPAGAPVFLYRGLKEPYRPRSSERVGGLPPGTDFTDCPHTALAYASGRCGCVLVIDLAHAQGIKFTEEPWFVPHARRIMVWGEFDHLLMATFDAKELRSQVRAKGVRAASEEHKADVLQRYVERQLLVRQFRNAVH